MLVRGAKVFNVFRKRFEERSVLIRDGLFVALGEAAEASGSEEILDAAGSWLVPGLVDIHMHIESSMTVPSEFSRAVLPHGTTTVVADPHEMANVFGVEGIRAFMDAEADLDIFYGVPSSVPSTNAALETSGGAIGPGDVAALAVDKRVVCLGEVMNAAELGAPGNTPTKELLRAFRKAAPLSPIEGHCPKLRGEALAAFIAAGVWADHTQQTPESILEKIDSGMFIELQRKSLTQENLRAVAENDLYEHVCLVTDDVMPDRLEEGHLDALVARAIAFGLRPEDAIYCATYVPSRHMGLRDRGAVAPGRVADFILLDDPDSFSIRSVYKRGRPIPTGRAAPPPSSFPPHFYTSVRRDKLGAADFLPKVPESAIRRVATGDETDCVAIRIEPNSTFTESERVRCSVKAGVADWKSAGLSLLAAIERYGGQSPVALGFVRGALTEDGAIATTWAHDHHNLLVLGRSIPDMVVAANALIEQQGGYLAVRSGNIVANAHLPVGGIVSDGPYEVLAEEIRALRAAMRSLGYRHADEIMSLSTLSLLVSPRLKMSDKGLVDVVSQKIVESYELPHR